MKKRKGFTLIELIIVLAILGMLLLFVIPNVGTARQKSAEVSFEMAKKSLYSAGTMFTLDFPNTEAVWASHRGGEKAVKGKEITKDNLHEAWFLYLDEFPRNPINEDVDFTVHIHKDGNIDILPETP